MARKYSILARTEAETFDELDWSITIADDRAEADQLAQETLTDDDVVEVGIGEYDDDHQCGDCGIDTICVGHIVGVYPEPEGMSYEDACAQAVTSQGLDPMAKALSEADIPFRIEQAGAYAMHLRIYAPGERNVLDITAPDNCWRVAIIENWHKPGAVLLETRELQAVVTILRARVQAATDQARRSATSGPFSSPPLPDPMHEPFGGTPTPPRPDTGLSL